MLKYIAVVTLVVQQLGAVEVPYRETLGYVPIHRGIVTDEQARLWAAPEARGDRFVILGPPTAKPVYLRIIEDTGARIPRAGTTQGWNSYEYLTTDPDALAARLPGSAFQVVGPPKDLWQSPTAPRAMQALGPAGEMLYFTRVDPAGFPIPIVPAAAPVDRVFIAVVGGTSMPALQAFYGSLGLTVSKPTPFRITVLSRALGLADDTLFPLSIATFARDFVIELDEYPTSVPPRARSAGSLPPGMALVSVVANDIDMLDVTWRAPPAVIAEFPYSGRRAAVTTGPAGEWLEIIEATLSPGPPPAGSSAPAR